MYILSQLLGCPPDVLMNAVVTKTIEAKGEQVICSFLTKIFSNYFIQVSTKILSLSHIKSFL